jgi:hypothetical protein
MQYRKKEIQGLCPNDSYAEELISQSSKNDQTNGVVESNISLTEFCNSHTS